MKKTSKDQGFTLLELMIVVAVIGILASIAYPSYQEYIYKGRRSDAKAGLLSAQLAQEKYRANCAQYASGMHASTRTCVAGSSTAGDHDLIHSATSPDGNYNLSISGTSALAYTLTATYTGVQTGDTKCKTLSINQDGVKTATNSADAVSTVCW
ncbi:MAG: prepilin-type N-terminal cleavage/methylation domain-containing protein [Methylomarinum sp.]|nr:prepilin-type N-terminal cleavage/methylation domain-containing protein [Methylomarinum sp.]